MLFHSENDTSLRATTILCVKKDGDVVMASDGQVSLGDMIFKGTANKLRVIGEKKDAVAGFAGTVADGLTLVTLLEEKLTKYSGDLERSVIELSKDWRTNKQLRQLDANIVVANKKVVLIVGGNGEVIEPESGIGSVGSGSKYAIAAARALYKFDISSEEIVRRAMQIASEMCVYTNDTLNLLSL